MSGELFDSLEFRNLFTTVWPDEATARAHRMRARTLDLSTLCYEACAIAWALDPSRALIDKAAMAGMRGYLDETRMIIAAMPATDADSLRAKLAALGSLDPLVSAHRHLPAMLKAALREDLRRIQLPNSARLVREGRGRSKAQGSRQLGKAAAPTAQEPRSSVWRRIERNDLRRRTRDSRPCAGRLSLRCLRCSPTPHPRRPSRQRRIELSRSARQRGARRASRRALKA